MNAHTEVFSKEFHQAMAMLSARAVKSCFSKDRKQKARSECLAHLRASLCCPAATGESTEKQRQEQV